MARAAAAWVCAGGLQGLAALLQLPVMGVVFSPLSEGAAAELRTVLTGTAGSWGNLPADSGPLTVPTWHKQPFMVQGCMWSCSWGWGQERGTPSPGLVHATLLTLPCFPQTPSSHSSYSPTATRSAALTCTGVTTASWSLGCATPLPWTSTSTRAHCTGLTWSRTKSTGESCLRMGVRSPGGMEQAGGGQAGGKAGVQFWDRVSAMPWCSHWSPQPL